MVSNGSGTEGYELVGKFGNFNNFAGRRIYYGLFGNFFRFFRYFGFFGGRILIYGSRILICGFGFVYGSGFACNGRIVACGGLGCLIAVTSAKSNKHNCNEKES
jgi:hypothetical protein